MNVAAGPKYLAYLFSTLILLLSGQVSSAQSKAVETTGDILLFTLPAAALGSSLALGDGQGSLQFTKGFVLNQALILGLKYATDKDRPYGNGERAFPSGHTSTTFQSATFIQRRYGWKYGLPAYILAGLTGFSRIKAQRHDGWDVLAGAVMGIGSSYLFTTPYTRDPVKVTFSGGKGNYQIGFLYTF